MDDVVCIVGMLFQSQGNFAFSTPHFNQQRKQRHDRISPVVPYTLVFHFLTFSRTLSNVLEKVMCENTVIVMIENMKTIFKRWESILSLKVYYSQMFRTRGQ